MPGSEIEGRPRRRALPLRHPGVWGAIDPATTGRDVPFHPALLVPHPRAPVRRSGAPRLCPGLSLRHDGCGVPPLSLDSWGGYTDASLDHALWFHRPRRADEWNLFDFQALVNASGRSTIRGTMYGEDGVLYLSMAQELLIRKL